VIKWLLFIAVGVGKQAAEPSFSPFLFKERPWCSTEVVIIMSGLTGVNTAVSLYKPVLLPQKRIWRWHGWEETKARFTHTSRYPLEDLQYGILDCSGFPSGTYPSQHP